MKGWSPQSPQGPPQGGGNWSGNYYYGIPNCVLPPIVLIMTTTFHFITGQGPQSGGWGGPNGNNWQGSGAPAGPVPSNGDMTYGNRSMNAANGGGGSGPGPNGPAAKPPVNHGGYGNGYASDEFSVSDANVFRCNFEIAKKLYFYFYLFVV